jgi:hypothetical protein
VGRTKLHEILRTSECLVLQPGGFAPPGVYLMGVYLINVYFIDQIKA